MPDGHGGRLFQAGMEIMVAYMALDAQERAQTQADDNEAVRRKWRNLKRGGVIGAAAVTGGTLLAITGGTQCRSSADNGMMCHQHMSMKHDRNMTVM